MQEFLLVGSLDVAGLCALVLLQEGQGVLPEAVVAGHGWILYMVDGLYMDGWVIYGLGGEC